MNRRIGRGRPPRKRSNAGLVFASVLTLINLILSFLLRISDRKRVLTAISNDDKVSLLYFGEKTTKTEEKS